MNRFFKLLAFVILALLITNCKKKDKEKPIVPPRDRGEVYNENIIEIKNYLKNNYLKTDANGFIGLSKITDKNTQTSIWDQKDYELKSVIVENDERTPIGTINDPIYLKLNDNVKYELYYLILNEGGGEHPITIDSVYTSYKGYNLENKAFDLNEIGMWNTYPSMPGVNTAPTVISGYRQILKKIKTASKIEPNEDGTFSYQDPGRLLVFIPSGLGYFNVEKAGKAYEPLIFDITLISKIERDHDGDGILSKYEDLNGNGDFFDDDTDNDKIPNFLDVDDDGDGFLTRDEISYETKDGNGNTVKKVYDFNSIPNCKDGKVKKHLDNKCH